MEEHTLHTLVLDQAPKRSFVDQFRLQASRSVARYLGIGCVRENKAGQVDLEKNAGLRIRSVSLPV